MPIIIRGAALALLVAAPLLGVSQQQPAPWPQPGQLLKEGIALHDKEDYPGAIAKYTAVTPGDSSYALVQTELAMTLQAAGKNEEAVAAARRALALQPFEPHTYNILANAQEELKQVDAALATYRQGLALFPYNQNLYYNQGVTYLRQGKSAEALAALAHSLELSPTHLGTHRLLAILAAQQGQSAHALISWLTYLALADGGTASHDILVQAERLSMGAPTVPENEKKASTTPNAAFAELDQLLESKVALQKSYVSKVKFDAAVVKQTQLLVEKFPVDGPADDFWVRAYGPMVAVLRQNDNLTPFTYLILQSADDAKAAQWVKSNKGKIEAMAQAVLRPLVALRVQQQVVGGPAGQRLAGWFNEGKLDGLGPGQNENGKFKATGAWISVSNQGAVDALGSHNTAGQRIGFWKVLRPDGTLDKTVTYNDKGEREGPAKEYHPNGQLAYELTYKADKVEGQMTVYNECGARTGTRMFKAGDLDGAYTSYYDNGQLRMRATTHADKVDGLEEGFYADGTPEYTTTVANGVKQGPFTQYYADKTLERKGSYDKGEYDGAFAEYYSNGQVSEEGRFAHGKHIGAWRAYFVNGKTSVEKSYDEAGELHGLYHDYDETGHLFSDTEYAHGRTVRLRYFDQSGKVASDQVVKKGRVTVQALSAQGGKHATGTFVDGQMAGEWQWFFADGGVREIAHYDDKGTRNGPSEFYYHGGQLQRRIRFAPDGQENGYFEQFTQDGQPTMTGYYQAGQRHGLWKDYYANGRVSEEYEYYKGEQNGPARSYEPGGKLTQERLNEFGKLRRVTSYDSLGKVITDLKIKPDTKELVLNYPSGKPEFRTGVVCFNYAGASTWLRPDGSTASSGMQIEGRRHGPYKSSFANGQPSHVGTYLNGQPNGEWTTYYPNGQLGSKGSYRNGEEEGEWMHYFPNGQIEFVDHYASGELHGLSQRFNPAGELLLEKNYDYGTLLSYRGSDTKAAFQPLTNQTGSVTATFANGKPAATEAFDHNLHTGTSNYYYASGEVFRRTTFAKGVRTGLLESFYPGGKPMEKEYYLHGELNGRCRYYRPDGTLEREETYRSGERSGPATYFDAAGKPQRTEVYWNQVVYDAK